MNETPIYADDQPDGCWVCRHATPTAVAHCPRCQAGSCERADCLGQEPPHRKCPKCDGCGRIGTDDDGTPWTFWENLPVRSAAAVVLGLVRPITCPECAGSGSVAR